jgi:hypothetical protein
LGKILACPIVTCRGHAKDASRWRGADGHKVPEVNSSPGLKGIERITGKDIAARIFAHVEGCRARMPAGPQS